MYRYIIALATALLLWDCRQTGEHGGNDAFNQRLADELQDMVTTDQIAAFIPQGRYTEWSPERWGAFKDSVFTAHKVRMKEIFDTFGFPGNDLVGEDGVRHFWLMVQHSDSDPEFQSRVLEKLKDEVDRGQADPSYLGFLTDRVRTNTGKPQVYGTQVQYNVYGQAYPRDLEDSVNVNRRRAKIGLEPLEEYLNIMTQSHFDMNKDYLMSQGIMEPKLYTIGVDK